MAGGPVPPIPDCRDLAPIGERLASTLYRAQSDRLGRGVTVTVFPALVDETARRRFDQAAATARRLAAHPHVLTLHEWGHGDDGRPWVVTDPQPAETVDTLLRTGGPLPVDRALTIGVLVAGALETAHRAGIVHGDLSPARLVLGPQGEPLVADMGLAEFSSFPGLGALHNPIRYFAPPEVLEQTGVSAASDTYSLAATVYALLAGQAPHEKPPDITDSNASLLLRILQIEVPPVPRPDLPAGIESALHAALVHAPEKRPLRTLDLAWSLQDVQRAAGLAVAEPVVLDLGGADPRPVDRPAAPPAGAPPAAPPVPEPSPPPGLATLPAWYTDPLPAGDAHSEDDLVPQFREAPPDLADRPPGPAAQHWSSGLDHLAAHAAPAGDRLDDDPGDASRPGKPAAQTAGPWPAASNGHQRNGDRGAPHAGAVPDAPAPWRFEPPRVPRIEGVNGSRRGGRRPEPSFRLDEDAGPAQRPPTAVGRHADAPGPPALRPPAPGEWPAAPPWGERSPAQRGTWPAARQAPDVPSGHPRRRGVAGSPAVSSPVPPGTQPHPASPSAATGAFSAAGTTRLSSALDRARQMRASSSRLPRSGAAAPGSSLPTPELQPPNTAEPTPGAAPALPVIVLIVVVVLLTLGVAYMVITDNGTTEPANDQPGAATTVSVSVVNDRA